MSLARLWQRCHGLATSHTMPTAALEGTMDDRRTPTLRGFPLWAGTIRNRRPPRGWILRRPTGRTSEIEGLAALKENVLEGRAERCDEVLRDGERWERLDSIAELDACFGVVDATRPQTRVVTGPLDATPEAPVTLAPPDGNTASKEEERAASPLPSRTTHVTPAVRRLLSPSAALALLLAAFAVGFVLGRRPPPIALARALASTLGDARPQPRHIVTVPATVPAKVDARPVVDGALALLDEDVPGALSLAREELRAALAIEPGDARALAGLARSEAFAAEDALDDARDLEAATDGSDGDAQRIEELFAEAAARIDSARELADSATGSDPEAARTRSLVAALAGEPYAQVGSEGDAWDSFIRGVIAERTIGPASSLALGFYQRSAPDLARAKVRLARVLAARGHAGGARAYLAELLSSAPSHARARALDAAIAAGNPPLGASVDQRTEEPRDGHGYYWYVARGDALLAGGQIVDAAAFYEEARALRPVAPDALAGIGDVRLADGDLSGAASSFEEALRLRPGHERSRRGLREATRVLEVLAGAAH